MRKIDSIDSTGKVLFVDDKGTGTQQQEHEPVYGQGQAKAIGEGIVKDLVIDR